MATAVKLSDDLARAAKAEARVSARSMTQQLEFWARIGRTVDRTNVISRDRIRAALSAQLDFDALSVDEQMVALTRLDEVVLRPQGDAEVAAYLASLGYATGLDAEGNLVRRDAAGSSDIEDADAYFRRLTGSAEES